VEHEKRESGEVKTHDEIMELFRELRSLEAKVKNPDLIVEVLDEPRVPSQEIESIRSPPAETIGDQHPLEPRREIQRIEKEKRKKLVPIVSVQKTEIDEQKKEPHSFWRKGKTGKEEPGPPTNDQQVPEEKIPSRSTFTLQLDAEGNLIGFPLKKQTPEKKQGGFFRGKNVSGQSEEEPIKGIKGRLLQMIPRRKSTESSSEESHEGIGSKIRGIFQKR
jgi:hypothetical protein